MGFASPFGRHELAALLAPFSRDVHNLVYLGLTQRLTELFAEDPQLVNQVHFRAGHTPLFTLPPEEAEALDMARFLIAHGADVSARNKDGLTAKEVARRQGLESLAQLLNA